MEFTALCFALLIVTLNAEIHKGTDQGHAFPHVLPTRQQFFRQGSINVNCEALGGPTEWRVMRRLKGSTTTEDSSWETSTRSRTITTVLRADSGEYWCEDKDGEKSSTVNITVVVGELILEIPPLAVTRGNVTLRCLRKETSDPIAHFYKDGVHIKTSYTGEMIIQNVSRSDEGFYRCNILGVGDSPESWLAVGASPAAHKENPPFFSRPLHPFLLLIVTVAVLVALLLLGLLHYKKHKVSAHSPAIYSFVQKREAPEDTRLRLAEEDIIYSCVNARPIHNLKGH